jgi:GLPGLI family protein
MKINTLLPLFILLFTFSIKAQDSLNEGKIVYTLTMESEENSAEMMSMMGESSMIFNFNQDFLVMDMNMMGGMMEMKVVAEQEITDSFMLMSMMGKKYHIVGLNEEDIASSNAYAGAQGLDFTYDKKDKKDILGYTCYKAIANDENGSKYTYYITNKIKMPKFDQAKGLDGFPLYMEVFTEVNGMTVVMEAKELSKNMDSNAKSIPEGYTKMTMEEFEKNMGAIGGE